MKIQSPPVASTSIDKEKSRKKTKRRHTRVHIEALRPKPTVIPKGSPSNCPKCDGLVFWEAGESIRQTIIRCLNCGWQPHFHNPRIQETQESRAMRTLTTQFVSGCDWDRLPVGW